MPMSMIKDKDQGEATTQKQEQSLSLFIIIAKSYSWCKYANITTLSLLMPGIAKSAATMIIRISFNKIL